MITRRGRWTVLIPFVTIALLVQTYRAFFLWPNRTYWTGTTNQRRRRRATLEPEKRVWQIFWTSGDLLGRGLKPDHGTWASGEKSTHNNTNNKPVTLFAQPSPLLLGWLAGTRITQ
uniref:(northern house mosquito) hypothetical protein n=1 Tax=Culex pipiens TaxID=7175 RepID=A0A8D8GSH1_CULPI